ncbi:hypothetical protein LMH87_010203 [Akanthomyces muscarius]|uniref:Uncharacterized protein n=1 Tax=Akanthomyces muscarius TaxID=2231603 RepID=A0A9W8UK96_AKAMU|nr:hypothetical protein LMH87_010203 [Akanthomyces muscarius]KAJ4153729.1 hypothetical protein LMH87_010203 [Akanthomyces muscarius]
MLSHSSKVGPKSNPLRNMLESDEDVGVSRCRSTGQTSKPFLGQDISVSRLSATLAASDARSVEPGPASPAYCLWTATISPCA